MFTAWAAGANLRVEALEAAMGCCGSGLAIARVLAEAEADAASCAAGVATDTALGIRAARPIVEQELPFELVGFVRALVRSIAGSNR